MMEFYLQLLFESFPFFLKGLWMTVAVAALGLIFATILGFLLGVMRASSKKLLTWPIGAYVFVIRGTPFVVQIFIIFFILLPIISILGVIAASALKKWRILVSPSSVKIAESAISVKTHELPTDEIEELELSPTSEGPAALISPRGIERGGILMRSDSKTLCFGGHLPEMELQYLHSLIRGQWPTK